MKSIRVYLERMVKVEVRRQLNTMLFGRKAGPRQTGLTRVRRKPDKAKAIGMANIHPVRLEPRRGGKAR